MNLGRVLPSPLKAVLRPLYHTLATGYYTLASRRAHKIGADRQRVAVVCPILLPGADAVSNDALGMYEAIVGEGLEADLYVARHGPDTKVPILTIGSRLAGYGLVIFHYMAFLPHLIPILRWPTNVVLKYHNITPGHFFDGYSGEYKKECESARAGLPGLLNAVPRVNAFADSEFNRGEILALGMQEAQTAVLPPFHQVEKLLRLRSDGAQSGNDILAVGRVVPNKGFDAMLQAFARVAAMQPTARLHVVGTLDERLATYHTHLRELVDRLRIGDRVIFHGSIRQESLAQLYADCACFFTSSQHEGFCVPVVEAMAFGKPIVSTRATALPDTCGGAAIYGDTEDELASAICELLSKPELRRHYGSLAKERYAKEFAIGRIESKFKSVIAPFLPRPNR